MSDLVIGDYTAALTIDGSTHYLLIQPGSSSTAYKRINRNVFLGVTGQPMDISTSQNVTNKTLDNTNVLSVRDDRFTLQDSGDTTKQAQFQLSGITTATTRTYTLPNASSTIADISTAQTLTNKALTSPVINNGSITGTTITTDAIVGQSASTSGTIYGLSIASAKVGANGIVTASITDTAVTPAKLQAGTGSTWVWQAYTPTYNNFTLGNGTVAAKYAQTGKTVRAEGLITLGSTSSVGSTMDISLPVTANARYTSNYVIGMLDSYDQSANTHYQGYFQTTSTAIMRPYWFNASATYTTWAFSSSTVPYTWTTSDQIFWSVEYEAA